MNVEGLVGDFCAAKWTRENGPLVEVGSPGPIGKEWGRTTRTHSQGKKSKVDGKRKEPRVTDHGNQDSIEEN